MPRTIRMLPFLTRPSTPASAWTWFWVHVDVWYLEPGAGGTSARMIGTPCLPASSIAADSATESAGLTMIALTPWRIICWIAAIWLSGVDCARLGGMFVTSSPVVRPAALAAANSVFRLLRTLLLYWLETPIAMYPIFQGGLAVIFVVAHGLSTSSSG